MTTIHAYRDDLPIYGVRSTLCVDVPDTIRGGLYLSPGHYDATAWPLETVLRQAGKVRELYSAGIRIAVDAEDIDEVRRMAGANGYILTEGVTA